MQNHTNRIASTRKQWALSQTEVARLLGVSATSISRIEKGERVPSLSVALGLELLFGVPAADLFPAALHAAASRMTNRAQKFSIALEQRHGAAADRKRALLQNIADRLTRLPLQA